MQPPRRRLPATNRSAARRHRVLLIGTLAVALGHGSTVAAQPACSGDCNGNGAVTISEIITLINIALGSVGAEACPDGAPLNGAVEVNTIIKAVNAALGGCLTTPTQPITISTPTVPLMTPIAPTATRTMPTHTPAVVGTFSPTPTFTPGAIPVFLGLTFLAANGPTSITLAWLPASDASTPPNAMRYDIYVSGTPDLPPHAPPTVSVVGETQATIPNLSAATDYYVVVIAVDQDGNASSPTEVRPITTAAADPVMSAQTPLEDARTLNLAPPTAMTDTDLTFSRGVSSVAPAVGAVLVGPTGEDGAYLRRVDGVTTGATSLTVHTTPASLSDAVDALELRSDLTLFDVAAAASESVPPAMVRRASVLHTGSRYSRVEWADHLLTAEEVDATMRQNGQRIGPLARTASGPMRSSIEVGQQFSARVGATFTPRLRTSILWDAVHGLRDGEIVAEGQLGLDANTSYAFDGAATADSGNVTLFTRTFSALYYVGPVPVFQQITLSMQARATATAATAIVASADARTIGTVQFGVRYDAVSRTWKPISDLQFQNSLSAALDVEGSVHAQLTVTPAVEVRFYSVLSGNLALPGNLAGDVVAHNTPCRPLALTQFDFGLSAECSVGVDLRVLYSAIPLLEDTRVCGPFQYPLFSLPRIDLTSQPAPAGHSVLLSAAVTDGVNDPFDVSSAHWSILDGIGGAIAVDPSNPLEASLSCTEAGQSFTVGFTGYGILNQFGAQCAHASVVCPGAAASTSTPTVTPTGMVTNPPAPSATPTFTPPAPCTPASNGTVGGSDIADAPSICGGTVNDVVSSGSAPHKVVAVPLTAGQEVSITLASIAAATTCRTLSVTLLSPDSVTVQPPAGVVGYHALAGISTSYPGVCPTGTFTYVPAVTGTYYVWVTTRAANDPFSLTIANTTVAISDSGATDIASAVPIGVGTVRGVVDAVTKRNDVYALPLTAGQEVSVTINSAASDTSCRTLAIALLSPDSVTVNPPPGVVGYHRLAGVSTSYPGICPAATFTYVPAASGTYYLWVNTQGTGDAFRVEIANTPVTLNDPGAADIAAAPTIGMGMIGSVVDAVTKRNDVYALPLTAGQEISVTIDSAASDSSCRTLAIALLSPDSVTVNPPPGVVGYHHLAGVSTSYPGVCPASAFTYAPAVSGTYYLWVTTQGTGDAFRLTIVNTPVTLTDPGAPDIASAPTIGPGMIGGVVDAVTKRNDVYALPLAAGQEVSVTINSAASDTSCRTLAIALLSPDSTTVAPPPGVVGYHALSGVSTSYPGICPASAFTYVPATTGTYYLWVTTQGTGDAFRLNIVNTPVMLADSASTDIAGAPLIGAGMTSGVVDAVTKPSDVYAIALAAGHGISVTASSIASDGSCRTLAVTLLSPDSTTIRPPAGVTGYHALAGISTSYPGICPTGSFTYMPMASGTYYLWVKTTGTGDAYRLTIANI